MAVTIDTSNDRAREEVDAEARPLAAVGGEALASDPAVPGQGTGQDDDGAPSNEDHGATDALPRSASDALVIFVGTVGTLGTHQITGRDAQTTGEHATGGTTEARALAAPARARSNADVITATSGGIDYTLPVGLPAGKDHLISDNTDVHNLTTDSTVPQLDTVSDTPITVGTDPFQDFIPWSGLTSPDGLWRINGPWIGTGGNYIDPALAKVVQTFGGASNGYLELSVAAATAGQTPYHGSELQSIDNYGYGTYETRMEVTNVPGVVASFFWIEHPSASQYGPHEWDIEFLTNESWISSPNSGVVHLTIHPSNVTFALPLSFNPSLGFHDYGFIWSSGQIEFTVDGAIAHTFTGTDLTTTATGLIIANTWTGNPNWGGGPPAQQATTVYDWMQFVPLCFVAGTRISTPTGDVPIEKISVGDRVLTFAGEVRRVVWVGRGRVLATRGQRSPATPVIVRKGAIRDNVPHHDLRVTKGHALYIDGVLIPVEFLVNHRSILWDDRAQEVELYHLELESHDVLVANGAPAESYRDDGNRWLFQNANGSWGLPPQSPCAPIRTGGPIVDEVWRLLLERAGGPARIPTTDDPDLHIIADGIRVDARRSNSGSYCFRLRQPAKQVRIVSRAGVPCELGLSRDPRPLGVALKQVMLWQAARLRVVEPSDLALCDGFHFFERENNFCWTDGDACLPAALFDGISGAVELQLLVAATAAYPLFDMVLSARAA